MKIIDLVNRMEEATSFMNETRVTVRQIHGPVMQAIKHIVEEAGLESHVWEITTKDECGRDSVVIKYNVHFTEDKRYKNDRVGKLHKMIFQPGQDFILLNDTVEEAVRKTKLNSAKTNLKRLQEELAGLYEQVNSYKQYIEEVQSAINELEK